MINLAITITTFSMMVMLFKYFDKISVNNLIAITFNYFTAGTLALSSYLLENRLGNINPVSLNYSKGLACSLDLSFNCDYHLNILVESNNQSLFDFYDIYI